MQSVNPDKYLPDYSLINLARLFHTLFSTKREEILVEYHVVMINYPIIVDFGGYMSIAMVLTHRQNEQHGYHYEI